MLLAGYPKWLSVQYQYSKDIHKIWIFKDITMRKQRITRWYQEPMMLLVLGVPVASVCVGFLLLTLAVNTTDSLVSDSYYKDGRVYKENRANDERARRLLIGADIRFDGDEIHLDLRGFLDQQPNTLVMQLVHPTLEDRDLSVLLQRRPNGQYIGINEISLPEKRHVWLQSPEQGWRVQATEIIQQGQTFTLGSR